MLHIGSLALVGAALLCASSALDVTLSNSAIRSDVNNQTVNSHSGNLYKFGDLFYLYGTAYENCTQPGPICTTACGYYNNRFVVYSSPDAVAWTLLSNNLVPAINADSATVEYDEVNVGYCTSAGDYVMIFWSGKFGFKNNSIAIARSKTPAGPFELAQPLEARSGTVISDTVSLFVDLDGRAYVRYNTRDAPLQHVVEALTSDWSATTGEYGVIFSKQDFPWYDGGGMMRRGAVYYVFLSFDCCFCSWGSDALVFVAPGPLGPWAPQSKAAVERITRAAAVTAARASSLREPNTQAASALEIGSDLAPRSRAAITTTTAAAGCDLSGDWSGSLNNAPISAPSLFLSHDTATNIVHVTGGVDTIGTYFAANNSLVFNAFPGVAPVSLIGRVGPFNGSSDACSNLSWLPPYTPPNSYWCRYPACSVPVAPPANWSNEVNFCADGTQPPVSLPDMTINPCSQGDVRGTAFTIPAQQFGVSTLANSSGGESAFLYFGERFRSTPNGMKSDDFQVRACVRVHVLLNV